jgi:fumarate reductase subunit C
MTGAHDTTAHDTTAHDTGAGDTGERRPFRRAQPAGWWAHPPYLAYTLRELTGVGIALYGAILLAGLVCLWFGPDAFAGYRHVLASPASLLMHLLLLAVMIWHVVTWCQILPKTMPKLILRGRPVAQSHLTLAALLCAAACSALLLAAVVLVSAWS